MFKVVLSFICLSFMAVLICIILTSPLAALYFWIYGVQNATCNY